MGLINADALKRRAITVRFFGKDIMMVPTAEIDDAPTIEAVEVVKCKDCRYAKLFEDRDGICGHPSNNAWDIFDEFYCGRGVKHEID